MARMEALGVGLVPRFFPLIRGQGDPRLEVRRGGWGLPVDSGVPGKGENQAERGAAQCPVRDADRWPGVEL